MVSLIFHAFRLKGCGGDSSAIKLVRLWVLCRISCLRKRSRWRYWMERLKKLIGKSIVFVKDLWENRQVKSVSRGAGAGMEKKYPYLFHFVQAYDNMLYLFL